MAKTQPQMIVRNYPSAPTIEIVGSRNRVRTVYTRETVVANPTRTELETAIQTAKQNANL